MTAAITLLCLLLLSPISVFADLPVPATSPNVQVASPKAAKSVYAPGEAADISVKVKNKSEIEIEALIILDIVHPDGTMQKLRSEVQTVPSKKSQTVVVQYPIPSDASDGTYFARVYIRNPYVREPYYVDDAVKVFEVKGGRKLDTAVVVKEETAVSGFGSADSQSALSSPEDSIPSASKTRGSSLKAYRERYAPGEVATIKVKLKNTRWGNIQAPVILEVILPDGTSERVRSKYQRIKAGATRIIIIKYPIPDNAPDGSYSGVAYLQTPDGLGHRLTNTTRVFEVVDSRDLDSEYDWPGSPSISSIPEASIPFAPKKESLINTLTPTFTWPKHSQAVSYKVYVTRIPFSADNVILAQGVTDLKFEFDPDDASTPLVDGRSYSFTVLPKTAEGATLVKNLDGFFSSFTVQITPVDTSALAAEVDPAADLKALKSLLNALKDALINNDRIALMALIHPDWISTDADFADYNKFDNTIRGLFNKITTTLATWSTENTDIISPGRRVTLTCTWRQTLYHTSNNTTRDINQTLKLDVRKENGKWLIREDVDKLIFRQDLGLPAALFGGLPPGHGTR